MSALERINNTHLELMRVATIGTVSGAEIADILMDNSHLWHKVYLPDQLSEHWMSLRDKETLRCDTINFMVPTKHCAEFVSMLHQFEPDCFIFRKMAVPEPYHSVIVMIKD